MTEEARIPKGAVKAAREAAERALANFCPSIRGEERDYVVAGVIPVVVYAALPALRKAIEGEIRERLLSDEAVEAGVAAWHETDELLDDVIRAIFEAALAALEEK